MNLVEVGQFFYALPSPNGAKSRSLCREYALPRDEKENCAKGWIESDARFGPVSYIKVCKTHERYSVEIKVPSFFEDQTTSWIRILSGVEKYVREALPIQEEERTYFVHVRQRKWMDIDVQKLLPDVKIHYSVTSTQGSWSRR